MGGMTNEYLAVFDSDGQRVFPSPEEVLQNRAKYRIDWTPFSDLNAHARPLEELLRDAKTWMEARSYLRLWLEDHPDEVRKIWAHHKEYESFIVETALRLLKFSPEHAGAIQSLLMNHVVHKVVRPWRSRLRRGLGVFRDEPEPVPDLEDCGWRAADFGEDARTENDGGVQNERDDLSESEGVLSRARGAVQGDDDVEYDDGPKHSDDLKQNVYVHLVETVLADTQVIAENILGYVYQAARNFLIDEYRRSQTAEHPDIVQVSHDDEGGGPQTDDDTLSAIQHVSPRRRRGGVSGLRQPDEEERELGKERARPGKKPAPERWRHGRDLEYESAAAFDAVDAAIDLSPFSNSLTPQLRTLAVGIVLDRPKKEIAAELDKAPQRITRLVKQLKRQLKPLARRSGSGDTDGKKVPDGRRDGVDLPGTGRRSRRRPGASKAPVRLRNAERHTAQGRSGNGVDNESQREGGG